MTAVVPPLAKFNLLYHVAPFLDGDAWRRNLRQLTPARLAQFNGKRVIAVAVGDGLARAVDVREALPDAAGVELLEVPNDPVRRERASLFPLLERVQSLDPGEASLYAHAKGVTRAGDPKAEAVMYWRNLMYQALLDQPARVRQALRQFPVVGGFRKARPTTFKDGTTAPWHFSGTFFWFRHDAFFARAWRQIPDTGWAVESCVGNLFRLEEGHCLVKDGVGDPYHLSTYAPHERVADDPTPPLAGLLVELGGGPRPRPGYVNVDRCPTADVVIDFENLQEGDRLPFETDSVAALYTSHCVEHVRGLVPLMREVVRICKVGAAVEIRVPAPFSSMAMCPDHKHVIGYAQAEHWTTSALDYWWRGLGKKLTQVDRRLTRGPAFDRWRRLLPQASEADILELCPDAAHEVQWAFTVTPYGG